MSPLEKYVLLLEAIFASDYLKNYKTDLTHHDKRYIMETDPKRFIVGVRESGTHFLNLDRYKQVPAYNGAYTPIYWFYFDGEKVCEVSIEEIKQISLDIPNNV